MSRAALLQWGHDSKAAPRVGIPIEAARLLDHLAPTAARPGSRPRARIVVLAGAVPLAEHLGAWNDLAAHAIEANAFYEPWLLLPAIDAYGEGLRLQFVLVYLANPRKPDGPPQLCGFFPLERVARYRGHALPHLRLWQHRHCVLGTPLLRAGQAQEALAAFLGWLSSEPGGAVAMEWGRVSGDGLFHKALELALDHARLPRFLAQRHTRGVLRRRDSAEAYIETALPKKDSRRELRRLERRLGEIGKLSYEECRLPEDMERWIDEFVALEGSGWKGRLGSALGSTEANRRFFLRAAREGARQGRLQMLGLRVDGRPVALKCNFLAAAGTQRVGFTFKIGYDEAYSKYSPGTLLELENIRRFHARPELLWMDSCAIPEHFMINRLWLDRRVIDTLLVSTGRPWGSLVVRTLPVARWLVHQLNRWSTATA
jgi:CelD/BcsL family acetyltransferase involved in cellulose biosynthesis